MRTMDHHYPRVPEPADRMMAYRPLYRGTTAQRLDEVDGRTLVQVDAYVFDRLAQNRARDRRKAHQARVRLTRSRQYHRAK